MIEFIYFALGFLSTVFAYNVYSSFGGGEK